MHWHMAAVAAAFVTALAATPLARKLAFAAGAVDRPDGQRKVHGKIMPRAGGLAVYAGFAAGALILGRLSPAAVGIIAGGSLIVLLGFIDDWRGVSPWVKLAGQVAAALVAVRFGLRVEFLTNPFDGGVFDLGLWSVPVTVFWIVAVTNALNLIDGLDGLAGGTAGMAALTLACVVWVDMLQNGVSPVQAEAVGLALALAAAVAGFLPYNFYPARVFLGDCGSLFLGYTLAVLAVMGLAKGATFISVVIPVVILGIPLLDTAMAVVRRLFKRRPVFQPDREHLHHRLLQAGMSHVQAVLCLYAVNALLGVSALVMTVVTPSWAVVTLIALSTASLAAANKLSAAGAGNRTVYTPAAEKQQRSP